MNSSHPQSTQLRGSPLPAVGATADGLAEALDILCDISLPEATRQRALVETWWYLDRFRGLNYAVELKDAQGDVVSLDRQALPTNAIDSITFRSAHMITGRMLSAALFKGDRARFNMLLSRHTSLGAATLILPVKPPPSAEEAVEPPASHAVPGDLGAGQMPEQPQPREGVRSSFRLILGEGQSRTELTPGQRAAIDDFLGGVDLMNQGLLLMGSTLPSLLEVPEAAELLEQRLPGFKEAMAKRE